MKNLKRILIILGILFAFAYIIVFPASAASIGDLDNDGSISASDARFVLRVSAELEEISAEQIPLADVDFDGDITAADARIILRVSAELEEFKTKNTTASNTTSSTTSSTKPYTGLFAGADSAARNGDGVIEAASIFK